MLVSFIRLEKGTRSKVDPIVIMKSLLFSLVVKGEIEILTV